MERVRVNDTQKMVWDWAWAHTGETTTRLLDFSKKASCSARWTFIWTLSTSNEWNYIWHKVYHLQHISWFCFPLARLLCLASLLWYRGQLLWQKWILWQFFSFTTVHEAIINLYRCAVEPDKDISLQSSIMGDQDQKLDQVCNWTYCAIHSAMHSTL